MPWTRARQRLLLPVFAVLLALVAGAAPASAQQLVPPPLGAGEEPVTNIDQPNRNNNDPVFDKYFTPSGASSLGTATSHVATAVGGGRVYAVAENDPSRVFGWDATTLAASGGFNLAPPQGNPRGLAYYRGELYVGDTTNSNIKVYNVQGTPTLTRTIGVPQALSLVNNTTGSSVRLAENLHLTGLDVAWQEVWATFTSGAGGRAVIAFDAASGVPKAAMWHLPRYSCNVFTFAIWDGEPPFGECDAAEYDDSDTMVGTCVPSPTSWPVSPAAINVLT